MTLIVAKRFSTNETASAMYLYDSRVTQKPGGGGVIQEDSILKWQFFDGRIAFATAGSVEFWRHAGKYIEESLSNINIDNILESDGPFCEALLQAAWSFDSPTGRAEKFGALGFIIDIERNENIQFAIEGNAGKGAIIRKTDELEAFGSGSSISELKGRILRTSHVVAERHGNQVYELTCAIRNTILSIIEWRENDAFTELGVSPIMGIGILENAHFELVGEDYEGVILSKSNFAPTGYSIRTDDAGNIFIEDKTNGVTQELLNLDEYTQKKQVGKKLDPQRRSRTDQGNKEP